MYATAAVRIAAPSSVMTFSFREFLLAQPPAPQQLETQRHRTTHEKALQHSLPPSLLRVHRLSRASQDQKHRGTFGKFCQVRFYVPVKVYRGLASS
jgi:hypothetical protein